MSLLAGPVVFIDDQLEDTQSQAYALLQEIRATGRPVATDKGVPEDRESWFAHWQSLAFVVLDWDLSPGSMGSTGGATLSAFERKKLYDFLVDLMKRIYCPIFIISGESTDEIQRQLSENGDLMLPNGKLDARIAVFPKDTLMDKLVEYLTDWVSKSPALSALKAWEGEYDAAKNKLFIELNELEPDWPAYVWQAADTDHVDPAYELASVISVNLLNRFNPVVFDVEAITGYQGDVSGTSRLRIAQGRTLVPGDRLAESMVFPGDLFKFPDDDGDCIWMNVSPVCQSVGRDGKPVRLHLLKGERQGKPSSKNAFNTLVSAGKGPNKILIHTLLEEHPYIFAFGEAQIANWDAVKSFRIGRLLSPYITRVQQMHAAYIQSEGLPKVTHELYVAGQMRAR